jgi:hypothetical protein
VALPRQNDPEQPVDGTQSRTRSLGVQSKQLLPKGEILQQKLFSGANHGDDPAEQMLKADTHHGIIAKSAPRKYASKPLILRTRRVLARHGAHSRITINSLFSLGGTAKGLQEIE